jgi:hypothetical protein
MSKECADMTSEKLKEMIRRLTAKGYALDLDRNGAGTITDGSGVYVGRAKDGDILFMPENRELAYRVRDIRDEVDEYMTEFERVAPDEHAERDGTALDTRTLLKYNGAELAGRYSDKYGMDFVTWLLDRNGSRELGHYIGDYGEAKEDFAARARMIDRNKLFTETELTVIRSNLSAYLSLDSGGGNLSGEDEHAIKGVIGKIDRVITPEIQERAHNAEDQGYEPEQEL